MAHRRTSRSSGYGAGPRLSISVPGKAHCEWGTDPEAILRKCMKLGEEAGFTVRIHPVPQTPDDRSFEIRCQGGKPHRPCCFKVRCEQLGSPGLFFVSDTEMRHNHRNSVQYARDAAASSPRSFRCPVSRLPPPLVRRSPSASGSSGRSSGYSSGSDSERRFNTFSESPPASRRASIGSSSSTFWRASTPDTEYTPSIYGETPKPTPSLGTGCTSRCSSFSAPRSAYSECAASAPQSSDGAGYRADIQAAAYVYASTFGRGTTGYTYQLSRALDRGGP